VKLKTEEINDFKMDAAEFERTMRHALQVEPTVEQKKPKNTPHKKHKRKPS
jgi:predicted double-glycine peptidase